MSSFLRAVAMAVLGVVIAAILLAAFFALLITAKPPCDAVKADAERAIQAVSACANAPGCQFTSESIRVALEAKAAAESCK